MNEARRDLQHAGKLVPALVDFEFAIQFDPDSSNPLLPRRMARQSSVQRDLSQGEYRYDPFAYDVEAMGYILCAQFQVRYPPPQTSTKPILPSAPHTCPPNARSPLGSHDHPGQVQTLHPPPRPSGSSKTCRPSRTSPGDTAWTCVWTI